MPTFATLVRFSAQEITSYANPRKALEEGAKLAVERGIILVGSYATLGPYDVMLIYEAKDEKVAANLAMDFGLKWGGRGETWTLIPVKELRRLDKKRTAKA